MFWARVGHNAASDRKLRPPPAERERADHAAVIVQRLEDFQRPLQAFGGHRRLAASQGRFTKSERQRGNQRAIALRILKSAIVPRLGAEPLRLRKQHVTQTLGGGRRVLVVRLRLGQGQAALERTRSFVEIPAGRFQAAEVAERFHFGLAIAQLFGNAEGLPIPRMGLGVADAAFLMIAGADERADCLREIAALFGFERIDGGIV